MTTAARSSFDATAFAGAARDHGLVVVAGAGLSMGAPSSLPNWLAINEAFLDFLTFRLAEHCEGELGDLLGTVFGLVVERRDMADAAQPDLQAQLAEELLGEKYFRLFKPLDIDAWNEGHAGIAALAKTGLLRAVITTNFDRLIEHALRAADAKVRVYSSPVDFEKLNKKSRGTALAASGAVAVIKVHGSVDRPESMVDTLRQRVLGRPNALEKALVRLFHDHAVLVVGFSGADLDHDPEYLGLREGVAGSPHFCVVNQTGGSPRETLVELVSTAQARSRIVDGTLPDCVVDLATALGQGEESLPRPRWDSEMDFPGLRRAGLAFNVLEAIGEVSPVSAAVVLGSIASAAGSSDATTRLLRATMRYHLAAGLKADPALPTQLGMIAELMIEDCDVDPELSGDTFDGGGTSALRILSAPDFPLDTKSLALLSLALGLVGRTVESDAALTRALRESADDTPMVRADAVCILARTWTLHGIPSQAWVRTLRETYASITHWGDEVRRARVGVMLVRHLVMVGALQDAVEVLLECQTIERRLNLPMIGQDLVAVGGRLVLAGGRYDDAFRKLDSACVHYSASGHNLKLAETLVPLAEAAVASGNAWALGSINDQFETYRALVPGMAVPKAVGDVRVLCRLGELHKAREFVAVLGERGETNPWIVQLLPQLRQLIASAEE